MVGNVIKEIRMKLGLTQKEFAKMLGVVESAVSNWERNKRTPDLETLNAISRLSGVSLNKIADSEHREEHFSYAETYLDALDDNGEQYYAIKMTGKGMDKLRICDGDTLIVKAQESVCNNDIALVSVNGENPVVREYYIDGGTVSLTPHSTDRNYKSKFYNTKNNKIKIFGKIVANYIKF